jgi:hypothetical protein
VGLGQANEASAPDGAMHGQMPVFEHLAKFPYFRRHILLNVGQFLPEGLLSAFGTTIAKASA